MKSIGIDHLAILKNFKLWNFLKLQGKAQNKDKIEITFDDCKFRVLKFDLFWPFATNFRFVFMQKQIINVF